MAQLPVELILMRQLASYLATPIFLVGPTGELLFYNEAAEGVLGYRFDEAVELPLAQWIRAFPLFDIDSGKPLPVDHVPVVRALNERDPVHGSLLYERPGGDRVPVVVTAFPLVGQGNKVLGAAAIFWPASPRDAQG